MDKPDKNDFEEWLQNPVTQWVFYAARKESESVKESLASGSTLDSRSIESTALMTAGNIGYLDGLNFFVKLKGYFDAN